ncbi:MULTISPECIES: 4'-phosphopantetheinyl transferase family protein [unclassified Bradyrhizobium]|uniref:4'-phosphopantetheinyl transferase family protein n=1 Tax=unclassified Bradyrhizobium TaxID=2631580 RepID=UPI002916A0DB|nr:MULTISPECIES: 4'-phosphopantetheinyl transferase superfamily protein [unclassified Bradyrhizobium]
MPINGAAAVLAPDEREQASRFVSASLTRRFICKRATLRQILASYARTRAADIAFGASAQGKPFLLGRDGAASPLEFNASDAGEHMLVAIAMQRPIGVDIETIRQIEQADDIIQQHFSVIERATYRRLRPEQRLLAFFTGWTRKEAYIKAIGLGLHLPLNSFSVAIDPAEPARLIEIDGSPTKAAEWTLLPIKVPNGHVGAVVARGLISNCQVGIWPSQ